MRSGVVKFRHTSCPLQLFMGNARLETDIARKTPIIKCSLYVLIKTEMWFICKCSSLECYQILAKLVLIYHILYSNLPFSSYVHRPIRASFVQNPASPYQLRSSTRLLPPLPMVTGRCFSICSARPPKSPLPPVILLFRCHLLSEGLSTIHEPSLGILSTVDEVWVVECQFDRAVNDIVRSLDT